MNTLNLPIENNGLAYVYIVWGIKQDGTVSMIAICSDEENTKRYDAARGYLRVAVERTPLNHAFGRSMLGLMSLKT